MSRCEANSQRIGTQSYLFRERLLWNQIPENVKLEPSSDLLNFHSKNLTLQIFVFEKYVCNFFYFSVHIIYIYIYIYINYHSARQTLNKLENKKKI